MDLQKIDMWKQKRGNLEFELRQLIELHKDKTMEKSIENQKEILVLKIGRYNEKIEEVFLKLLNVTLTENELICSQQHEIVTRLSEVQTCEKSRVKAIRILKLIEEIKQLLISAKKYSIWDIIGSSLFVDMSKNSKLRQAQEMMNTLKQRVSEFNGETGKVRVDTTVQVRNAGLLLASDYIFDDIFSAMRTNEKINAALMRMEKAEETFQSVIEDLSEKKAELESELEKMKIEFLDDLLKLCEYEHTSS